MATEKEKTLAALRTAIQMEIDGKEFYLQASQSSQNPLGIRLFQILAKEEDNHRRRFEDIFRLIQEQKSWPAVKFQPQAGELKTIFSLASQKIQQTNTEMEAVQKAMEMENKTRDYYQEMAKKAVYQAEKEYLTALAEEEQEHHMTLLDYYEYLKDPAGWFTIKERQSLDGG